MAETKIIPIELKALICSHLLARYDKNYLQFFEMAPYDKNNLAAASSVAPLDIPDVRKTQRRVAALLGRDPVDLFPSKPSHRYSHGDPPYTDSEIHSIRRLLGNGSKRSRRHPVQIPLAPHNSWLGFNQGYDDDNDDHHNDNGVDNDEANLFDTSIFHDNTDPNSFKLPPVFAASSPPGGVEGLGARHNRVVPTVSERTFIDSNLRHKGYYTDRHVSNGHDGNNHRPHRPRSHDDTEVNSASSSRVSLPPLDPQHRDLISMKMDDDNNNTRVEKSDDVGDDDVDVKQEKRNSKGVIISKQEEVELMSSMMEMMSLESELTRAGSLLMDDNFVPMSVTITKLSQERITASPINEINHAVSGPAAGNLKENGRPTKTKNKKNNDSIHTNSIKNDTGYCMCKEPRPILNPSSSPCPCCLVTGGRHQTGCPQKGAPDSKKREATLLCNLCGKSIENRKRRDRKNKRQKGGTSRQFSGSGYARNTMTPETAINIFQSHDSADVRHRQKCLSGNERGDEEVERQGFKPIDQRVRFDENVKTLHLSPDDNTDREENGLLQEERGYETMTENGEDVNSSRKPKSKKLFVKRKDFKFPKIKQSVNIPNLGVSVHAMAYDLALKDARIEADIRKKRRKGEGTQPFESSGTIFSYFPLLKRPMSESDKTDIGVTSQETRKVTGKNYKNMRHIFGKVKLADYYPGGKKWRDI